MKKIVITCGLISGLIVSAFMLISVPMCYKSGNFEGSLALGYASMILAFSMVFVGIKNYRDKLNNGLISFGMAFKTGLYISLIASSIYVIAWLIYFNFFIPDFGDKYAEFMLNKVKSSGASQLEIDKQTREMDNLREMIRNPFLNALMTYAEILPVGLIVTLVCSFILKKKSKSTV